MCFILFKPFDSLPDAASQGSSSALGAAGYCWLPSPDFSSDKVPLEAGSANREVWEGEPQYIPIRPGAELRLGAGVVELGRSKDALTRFSTTERACFRSCIC